MFFPDEVTLCNAFKEMRDKEYIRKETIKSEAVNAIEPSNSITTDGFCSHNDFKQLFGEHKSQVNDPQDIGKVLP